MRRRFQLNVMIHRDAVVWNLPCALEMVNMGMGIDMPNRLTDSPHYYIPSGKTHGINVVRSLDRWNDLRVINSNLQHCHHNGCAVEFGVDFARCTICEDVDFWPAYECQCETGSKYMLKWGYLNLKDGLRRINGTDVRKYFSDNTANNECRCFWCPINGACGIQMEHEVLIWVDEENAFVELGDDKLLRRFGVVYIGGTITEGINLLSEYIRDLRIGRNLRERFEETDLNFKLRLPRGVRKCREDRDDYHDWSDAEMAEEGIRESGPCGNWPDYE